MDAPQPRRAAAALRAAPGCCAGALPQRALVHHLDAVRARAGTNTRLEGGCTGDCGGGGGVCVCFRAGV